MPKLLIVDDFPLIRAMLVHQLQRKGFDVAEAEDGPEGIHMAQTAHPDLILMDMNLPSMDGMEVAKALKDDAQTQSIPIIALTAYTRDEDRKKALDAGCDDYATKPVNLTDLLERIARLLA